MANYPFSAPTPELTGYYLRSGYTPDDTTSRIIDNYTPVNKNSLRDSIGKEIAKIQNFVNTHFLGRNENPVDSGYFRFINVANTLNTKPVYVPIDTESLAYTPSGSYVAFQLGEGITYSTVTLADAGTIGDLLFITLDSTLTDDYSYIDIFTDYSYYVPAAPCHKSTKLNFGQNGIKEVDYTMGEGAAYGATSIRLYVQETAFFIRGSNGWTLPIVTNSLKDRGAAFKYLTTSETFTLGYKNKSISTDASLNASLNEGSMFIYTASAPGCTVTISAPTPEVGDIGTAEGKRIIIIVRETSESVSFYCVHTTWATTTIIAPGQACEFICWNGEWWCLTATSSGGGV